MESVRAAMGPADFDVADPAMLGNMQRLLAAAPAAKSVSTLQNATRELEKFRRVTGLDKHQALTASPAVIATYLNGVREGAERDGVGPARVDKASAGIACMAALHGLPSPTDHPLCKLARDVASATLHPTPMERGELLPSDLKALIERTVYENRPLGDQMVAIVVLLMWAGHLRGGEAHKIMVHSDLMILSPEQVMIFLYKSKTDPTAEGVWVAIPAVPGSRYCPVLLLCHLLNMGGYRRLPTSMDGDVGPLLRAVKSSGTTGHATQHQLRAVEAPLSSPIPSLGDSTFRTTFKRLMGLAGVPEDRHVLPHSARIGAATAAERMSCLTP
jgi:hypothetical protein